MSNQDISNLKSEDEIPQGLNGKGRELLKEYIQKPDRDSEGPNKVTEDMCGLIHRLSNEGLAPVDISDRIEHLSYNAVLYHLNEKCKHEKSNRVTYSECGWMRVKFRKGAPTRTLALLYDTTIRAVQRHLSGECQHEDGIEPLTEEEGYNFCNYD